MGKLSFICILVCSIILFPNDGGYVKALEKEPITIGMRNNALNATIRFLSAQKKCNADEIFQYSINTFDKKKMNNACKEDPLLKAEITDITVVSSDLALASLTLGYSNRVAVQTTPVIKTEGKWRVLHGFNQPLGKVDKEERDNILEGINDFFTSMESKSNHEFLKVEMTEQEYKSLLSKKNFDYKVQQIRMLTDAIAVATININTVQLSKECKYVIYKEDEHWKVVANQPLVKTVIPKSSNPVEVK